MEGSPPNSYYWYYYMYLAVHAENCYVCTRYTVLVPGTGVPLDGRTYSSARRFERTVESNSTGLLVYGVLAYA
jgi:hypothetical protein